MFVSPGLKVMHPRYPILFWRAGNHLQQPIILKGTCY